MHAKNRGININQLCMIRRAFVTRDEGEVGSMVQRGWMREKKRNPSRAEELRAALARPMPTADFSKTNAVIAALRSANKVLQQHDRTTQLSRGEFAEDAKSEKKSSFLNFDMEEDGGIELIITALRAHPEDWARACWSTKNGEGWKSHLTRPPQPFDDIKFTVTCSVECSLISAVLACMFNESACPHEAKP